MNGWGDLEGRRVTNVKLGDGVVVRVEPTEDPQNPYVLIHFADDHEAERRFRLNTLRNKQFFDILVSEDGSKVEDAANEEHQAVGGADVPAKVREKRESTIRRIGQARGIRTLIHFTRYGSLRSILDNGLLDRRTLEGWPETTRPGFNDDKRLDGYPEAICLSISFPNYRMFYKYSNENRAEWVVLLLDSSILWKLNCAFFDENAACTTAKALPLAHRKKATALNRMFASGQTTRRTDLNIPRNYPTHPEAEVLVFESIPTAYIDQVCFYTEAARRKWIDNNADITPPTTCVNRRYFRPRKDWHAWSPNREDTHSYSPPGEEIPF